MAQAESTVEGLRDVFRCFICMERLQDARLCPHCSKFCCFQCIRRWLTEQRPQCPHCRSNLRVSELVKCRWAEEVTSKLETLDNSSGVAVPSETDACSIHSEKLSVFCWTCQACICHHCALWGGNHSGHTLKPLDDEYNHRVGQISQEVRKLRRRLCLLISSLQELEKNIEKVREKKEDRVREMRCAVEMMMARLDHTMKEKLLSLGGQKRAVSMEVEMVEGILSEVEHQLSTASHSSLVKGSTELFRMLSQIQRNEPPVPTLVPSEFESEMVPEFQTCIFVIQPYSDLRRKADAVYSPVLQMNGTSWRLKVYPDGNGVVRGNYLSVFLELVHGPPGQSKYEYRVEMCQQGVGRNPARTENVLREFASDFEAGECWGYNRFYKIDYLEREGYLDQQDDSLVMQFQIRPMGYYQKCKDMAWQIEELEVKQSQNESEMNDLKERLAAALADRAIPTPRLAPSLSESNLGSGESHEDQINSDSRPGLALMVQESTVEIEEEEGNENEMEKTGEETDGVAQAKRRLDSVVQNESDDQEFGGSLNLLQFLERDVEEQNRRQSTENDVEDEFAAAGGIREALEELNLALPDREHSDLLENWPVPPGTRRTFQNAVSRNESHRRGSTGMRLREAFRALEDAESEDGDLGWNATGRFCPTNSRHLQCTACSPQKKRPLYRKVKSRYSNVLRDEGFLTGGREETGSGVNSQTSSADDEEPRSSGAAQHGSGLALINNESQNIDGMRRIVPDRSGSMGVMHEEFYGTDLGE